MHYDMKAMALKPSAPKMLCLIMMLLIFWQIVRGTMSIYAIYQEKVPDQLMTTPVLNKPESNKQTLSIALFGEYVPENIDGAAIKTSMLNLNVVGIFYTENEAESNVLIHSAGDVEKVYHIGDVLPGGAILKRITPRAILVSHHGEIERLSLPKNELIFASPPKPLVKE